MELLEHWMARRILERKGIKPDQRLIGLLERLFISARDGHLCLEGENLEEIPPILIGDGTQRTPLVLDHGRLYLHRNWVMETLVIEKVKQLRTRTFETEVAGNLEMLTLEQGAAVRAALKQSFSIITGGPGTGKSYTAGCVIRALSAGRTEPFKVVIAAPTGKAAAHLETSLRSQGSLPEQLKIQSGTVHGFLKLTPGRQRWLKEHKIDADLVVVDEASMLDVSLLLHLLNAIGSETRLILLGDPDQLPPVEAGSLFPELAEVFGNKLLRSHRMGNGALYQLADAIQKGEIPQTELLFTSHPETVQLPFDFSISDIDSLIERLIQLLPSPYFNERPDPFECLQKQRKFRILCGLRQGPFGVDSLNRKIGEKFISQAKQWYAFPILICKTDARQNLFNGTQGILIRKMGVRSGAAYFQQGEKVVEIPEAALPHYEWGFCLSVHKSQGSEFEEVLALFPEGTERFGKEALYTAVTRAKKKVSVMADSSTLRKILSVPSRRRSGFIDRIN